MNKIDEIQEYVTMCAKTGFRYHNAVEDVTYLLAEIERKDEALRAYEGVRALDKPYKPEE